MVLLVVSLVVVVVTAWQIDDVGDFERAFSEWLSTLPGLLDPVWTGAFDLAQVWVVAIGLLALFRRRWTLLRDWAASLAIAVGGVLLVGRIAFAVSRAAPLPIPLARLTLLEFAITFVNLAGPSTAARVAVNIRFFQRNGLDRTTAIGVAGFDSVAGFVAQITLMLTIVGFGLGSLNMKISARPPAVLVNNFTAQR